jgi:uncharacterized cofD-like protein
MARIKALIFDLDDTLYDCTGLLVEAARRRAARAMVRSGLPCSEEEAYKLQVDLAEKHGPKLRVFEKIAETHHKSDAFVQKAYEAYNSSRVENIAPFPDVPPTLKLLRELGYGIYMITSGIYERQQRKINMLKIGKYFDDILIHDHDRGETRESCFMELLEKHNLVPKEVMTVGDRLHSEIRIANFLGMTTVQMIHGRFQTLIPTDNLEEPDFRIQKLGELPGILRRVNRPRPGEQPKIVAIGGGTGLPIVLAGLRYATKDIVALVTVTDSGRSSGFIRREMGVLPPGDIRNCLVALSQTPRSSKWLHELFEFRFRKGKLEGQNLGNLVLAALAEMTGGFEHGIREAGEIFNIQGKVLPSTLTDTHICARLADGTVRREEVNVRALDKSPIEEVFLEPADAKPLPEALEEIRSANLIVLGPGSLYTSVVTNLLVRGIPEAIRESNAKVVYVCNIATQPGQTDGYTAADHVRTVIRYLGEGALDYVLVNSTKAPAEIVKRYEKKNSPPVKLDAEVDKLGVKVIRADLIEKIDRTRILWEKADLLRHDPDKLAAAIMKLVNEE